MAINSQNKIDTGQRIKALSNDINDINEQFQNLIDTWNAKGFPSNGSDPIIDSDFYKLIDKEQPDEEGNREYKVTITASQCGDIINFGVWLNTWLNNGDPDNSNWQLTIDRARNV